MRKYLVMAILLTRQAVLLDLPLKHENRGSRRQKLGILF